MSKRLFEEWLEKQPPSNPNVEIYRERKGRQAKGLTTLKNLVIDHFVGEDTILKAGGFKKAAAIVQNSLPSNKRTRSGDFGELLATEYVNSQTPFVAPIKKLRWKSDRQMPMHGNDVVAVDTSGATTRVLKGECKSRAAFGSAVVDEAVASLDLHDGRPNPSTLAFIAKRLYEEGRDSEAVVFRDLLCGRAIAARNLTHLVFAVSGNDPTTHLATCPKSKHGIKRESVGVALNDYAKFIAAVYDADGT